MRLSNCVILNRVAIKNFSLIQDSIIGWSSKSEQGRWFGGGENSRNVVEKCWQGHKQ